MTKQEFKDRTKRFAVSLVKLIAEQKQDTVSGPILRQMLRSGTSAAANYRAACRAKSLSDMLYKLGIVEEELDETQFWLEIALETNCLDQADVEPLQLEAEELIKMIVASKKKLRARLGATSVIREDLFRYGESHADSLIDFELIAEFDQTGALDNRQSKIENNS